jgi:hypothetical protein
VLYGNIDARKTLVTPRTSASGLSQNSEDALLRAFAELPRGDTRDTLIDIARGARAALATMAGDNARSVVRDSVSELVGAASATTLDLARLDLTIATLDGQPASGMGSEASWQTLKDRCTSMRAERVAQLSEAVRVLGLIKQFS